jgi:hypothetical protein
MRLLSMIGLAAALASPAAFAGNMPIGSVTGYVTQTKLDEGGGFDDSGTGFGVRGWMSLNGPFFVHLEYQSTDLDKLNGTIDELRMGGGFVGQLNPGAMWLVKAEYIDTGSDADQSGFGVHGGVMFSASDAVGLFGTLGYITTDDTDGLEYDIGAKFNFTREVSGVLDYRAYMGSVDPSGDFDLSDLRFGVSYNFY